MNLCNNYLYIIIYTYEFMPLDEEVAVKEQTLIIKRNVG